MYENENVAFENRHKSNGYGDDDEAGDSVERYCEEGGGACDSDDSMDRDDGFGVGQKKQNVNQNNEENKYHSLFFEKLRLIVRPEIESKRATITENISLQLRARCNIVSSNVTVKRATQYRKSNTKNKSNVGATLSKFLYMCDIFDPSVDNFQDDLLKVKLTGCPSHFIKLAFLLMVFLQRRGNYCTKTAKSKFLQYMVCSRQSDYADLVKLSKQFGVLLCSRNGLEMAMILKAFVDKTDIEFRAPVPANVRTNLFYTGNNAQMAAGSEELDRYQLQLNESLVDDYTGKRLLTTTHRDLSNPCTCCQYTEREKINICASVVVDLQQAAGNMDIFYELELLKLKIAYPGQWSKEIFLMVGCSNSGKTNYCEGYLLRIFDCRDTAKISAASLFQQKSTSTNIHHISNTPVAVIDEVSVIYPQTVKLIVSQNGQEVRRMYSNSGMPVRNLCKIILIANEVPEGTTSDDGVKSRIRFIAQQHWFSPLLMPYDRTINPTQMNSSSEIVTLQYGEKKFPQNDSYVKDYAVYGGSCVLYNFSNVMFFEELNTPVDCTQSLTLFQFKNEMLMQCDDLSRFLSRVTIVAKECTESEMRNALHTYIQIYYRGNSKLYDSLLPKISSTLGRVERVAGEKGGEVRFTKSIILKP